MNITKVKYERLFPCGAYLNEKIGFEAEMTEPYFDHSENGGGKLIIETPQEAIEKLRQLAEDIHKEKYPHFYNGAAMEYMKPNGENPEYINQLVKERMKDPKDERIQSFIATINMCGNKKFLENFRTRVAEENNPELTEAFNNKLKSFE